MRDEEDIKRRIVVIVVLAIMPALFICGFAVVLYHAALSVFANHDVGPAMIIVTVAASLYAHISKTLVTTWYSATMTILKDGHIKK